MAVIENLNVVGEDCPTGGLVATAATAVFPFHLDHPVMAAEGLIEPGAVGRRLCGAKFEVALVGIFLAGRVKPGVQIGISDRFFSFVRNDIDHSVRAAHTRCRAVRTGSLDFAAGGTLVSVADKCPLDIGSVERLMGVESTELRAESTLFDVGRGRKYIHTVGISRQSAAGQLSRDRCGNLSVPEPCSLRAGVTDFLIKQQIAAHVAGGIAVGGIDSLVPGAAESIGAKEG